MTPADAFVVGFWAAAGAFTAGWVFRTVLGGIVRSMLKYLSRPWG